MDYVIEFSKSIDNLVSYFSVMSKHEQLPYARTISAVDYYFDVFLQEEIAVSVTDYVKEIERYNSILAEQEDTRDQLFLEEVKSKYAEFESFLNKYQDSKTLIEDRLDLLEFIMEHSQFLNKEENKWMKMVIEVIRNTSLYFQPQIRTKILNEGWASFWHEELFLHDNRIRGHEIDFAAVNAKVTSMRRVGLNPYALGMRLFSFVESLADRGRISIDYDRLRDRDKRKTFDNGTGTGRDFIFNIRKTYCDSMFISDFINQDFVAKIFL